MLDTDDIVRGQLYNATEAMHFLNIGRTKFYALVRRRSIATIRIGNALRFYGKDILRFIEKNRDCGISQ